MWFKTEDGRIYAQKAASDFDKMENTIKAQGGEKNPALSFLYCSHDKKDLQRV